MEDLVHARAGCLTDEAYTDTRKGGHVSKFVLFRIEP